jgi:thiamine biosynthesis lipoprotein
VYDEIKQEILRINDVFSRTAEGSELYALNTRQNHPRQRRVLCIGGKGGLHGEAVRRGVRSPPSVGITALWNIATDHPRVPSQEEIDQVDRSWQEIVMDPAKRRITIPKNMDVDLGGIAKGYAADRAHEIMEKRGVVRGIINLGGNVYAIGSKENGELWTIGLRDPNGEERQRVHRRPPGRPRGGHQRGYERFFVQDGKTYQHILDPKTGWPAESDLLSSSIIGTDSTVCDALSTAVYVLGSEKGLR